MTDPTTLVSYDFAANEFYFICWCGAVGTKWDLDPQGGPRGSRVAWPWMGPCTHSALCHLVAAQQRGLPRVRVLWHLGEAHLRLSGAKRDREPDSDRQRAVDIMHQVANRVLND